MNRPTTKTLITIELHCLQLLYARLRLHRPGLVNQLTTSMETYGQLAPVVIVPAVENQWILIDGYLRVSALRRLGFDTIHAEIWTCDPAEALLTLLTEHQSRTWEAIEEALLLQELHTQHGLLQSELAARMGRDQSWVSRRLALLETLSEPVQKAITSGKLSPWSAVRVLAPMARAIPTHAELLLQHALKQPLSTREFHIFYDHYQRANHHQRSKMVHAPELFFKAQKLLAAEKQAKLLQTGVEGQWRSQWHLVSTILTSLIPLTPNVFTFYQEAQEQMELINLLHEAKTQFDLLTTIVRNFTDARKRHEASHRQPETQGTQ